MGKDSRKLRIGIYTCYYTHHVEVSIYSGLDDAASSHPT